MEEWIVWGPPGTGKTTWIAKRAGISVQRFAPDLVSICSLTNAAVEEIISRDIPIDLENVTTLHARSKRALNAPAPAESRMREFAEAYPKYSSNTQIPLNRKYNTTREESVLESGFTTYDQVQIARQQMIPEHEWKDDMREWYNVWNTWCLESGLMDYTTWLTTIIQTRLLPPQVVVYVDEAQDHTPLQLAAIRTWSARYLILVGDDDQSIYEWSGSIPREFLKSDIPHFRNKVLEQSYRVPRQVFDLAGSILERISSRKDKAYKPVDEEGSVEYSSINLEWASQMLMPNLDDGQTHMIIASCGYMLDGIIRQFRLNGIPFHNPYRKSNSDWNPMDTEAAIAARNYLVGEWTGSGIQSWMDIMNPSIFSDEDGLRYLCDDKRNIEIPPNELLPFLSERSSATILSRQPESLLKFRRDSVHGLWEYYTEVFKEPEVKPYVIIGTIHSVKGGEADVVHIFPDLSSAGYNDTINNPDRLHRLYYVAATRARHTVVLHEGSSDYAYPIGRRG